MLDVSLQQIRFQYPKSDFAIRDLTIRFARSTHTALVSAAAGGASTLLRLLSGELKAESGEIRLGTRVVNELKASRRPLLGVGAALDVPLRWSVEHALIAAVRQRTLDLPDRRHELLLAMEKWRLEPLRQRALSTLSASERTLVQLARIELLRPAILVADRMLEPLSGAMLSELADQLYRTLRVIGTTVISAPASSAELATCDNVIVLEAGRVIQQGTPATLFLRPESESAALATGDVNVIPITVRGTTVESIIGEWQVDTPPFQGNGVALVRPDEFSIAGPGEESDLIFGVEEAGFRDGSWSARGVLTGAQVLRVVLPRSATVNTIHKGRLLALRYDPARFRLLPRESSPAAGTPTDVVPPLAESR